MSDTAQGPGWWQASDGKWYAPGSSTETVPAERRKELLGQAIANLLASGGGRVESQGEFNAVLVRGSRPNHVLHLILTLVTCALWGLVWIVVALVQKEHRTMVSVDAFGNVQVQHIS